MALVVLSVVEQRLDAVRAVSAGAEVTVVAAQLGVHPAEWRSAEAGADGEDAGTDPGINEWRLVKVGHSNECERPLAHTADARPRVAGLAALEELACDGNEFEREGLKMLTIGESSPDRDPRHVFLDATAVMARYGWGKTKGYQNLKDRELVPPPVMIRPDRWRLDQLLSWEERRMGLAEAELDTLVARGKEELSGIDLLPQPKRRRRAG